jgi:DNA replication protein DnaC
MTVRLSEQALKGLGRSSKDIDKAPMVLEESIGDVVATCDRHGPYTKSGVLYLGKREVWTPCPDCEEARLAANRQAEAQKLAKRALVRMENMLGQAAIPRRFIGRSFENFIATTKEQAHALDVIREYVDNFPVNAERGASLVFSGMPGTGKSHLATAAQQALMPEVNSLYITCASLIRAVRATWSRGSERTEVEVLREFGKIELLVIDEVGATGGTDNEQSLIFEILDRRYSDMRPTILLTNQDKAGFRSFVGDRVFDRFTETARWVSFDWASYRPTARNALPSNDSQFSRNSTGT